MARKTLRARAEQIETDVALIKRWLPEMHRDRITHFNLSLPLVDLIVAGMVDRLTPEGNWGLEELEAEIAPLAVEARGLAAAHAAKVEALKAAAGSGWAGERILQDAAARFAPIPGRPWNAAEILAANGIDWRGACRIMS